MEEKINVIAKKVIELKSRLENKFMKEERKNEIRMEIEGMYFVAEAMNITEKITNEIERIKEGEEK